MKQRARGIKDPRWMSDSSGCDWIVFFCRVPRLVTQISEFSEWFLGTVLGWSADSTSCRDGSVAAHFSLDLEGSESKSLYRTNPQIIVPGEDEDLGVRHDHWGGLTGMGAISPATCSTCLLDHGDVYTSCLIDGSLTMEYRTDRVKETANWFRLQFPLNNQGGGERGQRRRRRGSVQATTRHQSCASLET